MKKTKIVILIAFTLLLLDFNLSHAEALLKIICDIDGGKIYVDKKPKGECYKDDPIDIIVPAGKHTVVVKRFNRDGSYYYFKRKINVGDGVRITITVDSELVYTEDYYYNKAKKSQSSYDYWKYLKNYPNGKYAKQVKKWLDEYYWKKCTDIQGCKEYLDKISWGKSREKAYKKIKLLISCFELYKIFKLSDIQNNYNLKKDFIKCNHLYTDLYSTVKEEIEHSRMHNVLLFYSFAYRKICNNYIDTDMNFYSNKKLIVAFKIKPYDLRNQVWLGSLCGPDLRGGIGIYIWNKKVKFHLGNGCERYPSEYIEWEVPLNVIRENDWNKVEIVYDPGKLVKLKVNNYVKKASEKVPTSIKGTKVIIGTDPRHKCKNYNFCGEISSFFAIQFLKGETE